MSRHHFISYSKPEARSFSLKLYDALKKGQPSFSPWLDERDCKPGIDWDIQIKNAIKNCETFLFVMTPDSVSDTSICRKEWTLAQQKFRKIIIPIRLDQSVEPPFLLHLSHYIDDFLHDFDSGIETLREHLTWLKTPEGELQQLEMRLDYARRDLLRVKDKKERERIEHEIKQLENDIDRILQTVNHPEETAHRTQLLIDAGIEREQRTKRGQNDATQRKIIGRPPAALPSYFQNRQYETRSIASFLESEEKRILSVSGRAGIGKTILVLRLLKSLEQGKLPDDLGAMNVDGIVYLNMSEISAGVFPGLFESLFKLLSKETQERLTTLYRNQKSSSDSKVRILLNHFTKRRVVVLLDNFEDILDSANEISDRTLNEALRALLTAPQHAVKIIITTRAKPQNLFLCHPERQELLDIEQGLEFPHAEEMLRALDGDGILGLHSLPVEHPLLSEIRAHTRGFPRALEAVVAILKVDRCATLQDILIGLQQREEYAGPSQQTPENVVEAIIGDAFSRLDPFAQQVMQALSVYNRPVPAVAVDYLLQPYRPSIDSAPILRRLVNMNLVYRELERYYLHPLDRAYAVGLIDRGHDEDRTSSSPPSFTQIALFARAADFSRRTRRPYHEWKSLKDLEPQLREIEYRIEGEDYDTAAEVLREIDEDFLFRWGHFNKLIQFYEQLHKRVRQPFWKWRITGCLGSVYLNVGRVNEAVDRLTEALVIAQEQQDRSNESRTLGRLGWARLNQGQYTTAKNLTEQSLQIAQEVGEREQVSLCLGMLGTLYLIIGPVESAFSHYEDALKIAQDVGNKEAQCVWLGHLGHAHIILGQIHQAEHKYEQALAIAEEIGSRQWRSVWMSSQGHIHYALGRIEQAINLHQEALVIARELGARPNESNFLGNLGVAYGDLGQHDLSIHCYEQALVIDREMQLPSELTFHLCNLGNAFIDVEKWDEAKAAYSEALEVADRIGLVHIQIYARWAIALIQLLTGNISTAESFIADAGRYDYPTDRCHVLILRGIIALRNADDFVARESFTATVVECDRLLGYAEDNFDALDTKGLALCGLILCEDHQDAKSAIQAFRSARAIMAGEGYMKRILRLFDSLTEVDDKNLLLSVRAAILNS